MRRLLMVLCVVCMSVPVEAKLKKGPWPSDPDLAKVEQEIEEKEQPCKKLKNVMAEMNCYERVWLPFNAAGRVRGTGEYVDLHYVDLPTPELQEKLTELRDLKERARPQDAAKFDREPGELSEEDDLTEINLVEIELGKREVFQYKENLDFLKKRPATP